MSVHSIKSLVPTFSNVGKDVVLEASVPHLTSDSRAVREGSVFFAIRGTFVDGHTLIPEMLKKGVAALIIDNPQYANSKTVQVPNTRESFALASAAWSGHPSKAFQLVGITGTNGKTTCSYLLEQVWRSLGKTTGLIGTVETKIADWSEASALTTPGPAELQTLFQKMKAKKVSHAVMEVSSIALDQYRPAGTSFEVALFTNFTQDHLDYHTSMEDYFLAKTKLFTDYKIPFAVLNAEDPASSRVASLFKGEVVFYGKDSEATFRILDLVTSHRGSTALFQTPIGKLKLSSPLLGEHNVYNCLGVLGVNHFLGIDLKDTLASLEKAPGAPGRLERVMPQEGYPSVFVDYAHSDDALKNVLSVIRHFRKEGSNRVITVFGCGGDRDRSKRSKMAEVVSSLSDVTIATSDNPRTEDPGKIIDDIEAGIDAAHTRYIREIDRRSAIREALSMANPEDLVLIAGKGHETYQILGTEKVPFDDRLVVREYYS